VVTHGAFARSALASLLLTLIILVCKLLIDFVLVSFLALADGDSAQPSITARVLFSLGQARLQ
jgi:hypothetical protein